MNKNNLIRIDNIDQTITRIFPLYRIEEIFLNRFLVLTQPQKWDDPFENFLLKCTAISANENKIVFDEVRDSWFGSCWSLNDETDAMWRIYSKNKNGIRVKTKIKKIADALWEPTNEYSLHKYFIGKVEYKDRVAIEKFLERTSFFDSALDGFAETLLTKRKEFEHENEVRVLAYSGFNDNDSRREKDLYKVPISPDQFIDELCIDPRISKEKASFLKRYFYHLGYTGPVVQSDLYTLNITEIRLA